MSGGKAMLVSSVIMSLIVWLVFLGSCVAVQGSQCPSDVLVMYRMVMHMEWSEESFPKQYPEWRPPAQWSVVVGKYIKSFY